jgi:flagellar export protein FliJ
MKSRKSLIQRCRFEVNERQQVVAEIESMMGKCKQNVVDLEHQIEFEQERSGVDDVNHCTYPPFAKAAIQRRDNLKNSVRKLESKLEEARDNWAEAYEELKKIDLIESGRTQITAQEQAEFDETGLMQI